MPRKLALALLAVGAELGFGALARLLDAFQGPLTDGWCWLLDRGWVRE